MLERLLITGAAGHLGHFARRHLRGLARHIRVSDIASCAPLHNQEEVMQADLADPQAVADIVAGCDGILHLGGVSTEAGYDVLDAANLRGIHNLYEAARLHGQPRILFASSNHTIGFYPQDQRLTAQDPLRPDSWYGVTKVFGEAVAQMYYAKFGQESALVRIGSCYDQPTDRRMLSTWLSPRDFCTLIERVFSVPRLGCPVIWGVSDNTATWWDNSHIRWLGWQPEDNAEDFRAEIEALPPRPADAPDVLWQGGLFTAEPIRQTARTLYQHKERQT